ncbi:MAG: PIN domain-containing protein [Pseudomonadota bacterium]
MRMVLDACVLFPNVMRSVLLAVAKTGAFEPIWSPRLLEEWRRAALRHSPELEIVAATEIALLALHWPGAKRSDVSDLAQFWLPDPNDVHVLALAVDQKAQGIITANAKDFPRHILAEYGLSRADPDGLLCGFAEANPGPVQQAVLSVVAQGTDPTAPKSARAFLKKARLPRLGKWVEQAEDADHPNH